MVTSQKCYNKYGDPELLETQMKWMLTWQVPDDIQKAFAHVRFSAVGTIGFPKKIFLNKDMQAPLEKALRNVIGRGLAQEMKTWDGCFIIRQKRGLKSMSLHSWGIACDINASENRMGQKPKLTPAFVKCFKDEAFDWGGDWQGSRTDGMHFQLASI